MNGGRDLKQALGEVRVAALAEWAEDEAYWAITDKGRRAIGAIMAAVRLERHRRPSQTVPLSAGDCTTFLAAPLPLVRLCEPVTGAYVLRVGLDPMPGAPRSVSLWVRLRRGHVIDRSERPPGGPLSAIVTGSVDDWLDALLDGELGRLQLDRSYLHRRWATIKLLEGIHDQLRPGQRPGTAIVEELGADGRAILGHFCDRPPTSAGEIAKALELEPGEVEGQLRRMADLGLLRVSAERGEYSSQPSG